MQLKNQLVLAQAQSETVQLVARTIPEEQHMCLMSEKDRRIEALVLILINSIRLNQLHMVLCYTGATTAKNGADATLQLERISIG